ncbi:hypothetical protein P167DRAFT_534782 [Morchella conica CCBAS932]|uniref:Uncharacterized protein n=1 Tax=Morchella conica CCBAS932 TaxID=1392247 RepID=A0A3N4KTE8_9PEZI|nr:hypothetical protein P167DRAFT_534782 [Morchella conica CCBAS932]
MSSYKSQAKKPQLQLQSRENHTIDSIYNTPSSSSSSPPVHHHLAQSTPQPHTSCPS